VSNVSARERYTVSVNNFHLSGFGNFEQKQSRKVLPFSYKRLVNYTFLVYDKQPSDTSMQNKRKSFRSF